MNAARIRRFRERAQAVEDATNPCRIRIDSGPWIPAAMVNRQAQELDLALGGARTKGDQVFRIRKSFQPLSPIAEKTKITHDDGSASGAAYRVKTIDGDQVTSPAWLVVCESWTR